MAPNCTPGKSMLAPGIRQRESDAHAIVRRLSSVPPLNGGALRDVARRTGALRSGGKVVRCPWKVTKLTIGESELPAR